MENILTPETFIRWFSSKTDADSQLRNVILTNNFQKKTPTFLEISNTLFRCNNIYLNYKIPEQINTPMHYPAHITDKTTNAIINIFSIFINLKIPCSSDAKESF